MKLIIVFGPPAVGKMTVGYELSRITGLKLLHNHMTSDLVLNFFDWEEPQFELADEFRLRILEEFVSCDQKGIILTYAWALDLKSENEFVEKCCKIFQNAGAPIYYVELEADLEIRKKRNESKFRLEQKASKRNIEKSRKRMLYHEKIHVFNSSGISFQRDNHIVINNTYLAAAKVALKIARYIK